MNTIVFEDSQVIQLAPITTSKPAYATGCASYRLIDLLGTISSDIVGVVRPFLANIQQQDYPELAATLDTAQPWTLLVNARLVPSIENMRQLKQLVADTKSDSPQQQGTAIFTTDKQLIAATVPTVNFADAKSLSLAAIESATANTQESVDENSDWRLFNFPHDVIVQNLETFKDNLQHRIQVGHYNESEFGVYLGEDVKIGPHVVFDTSAGPVVLDSNVQVGPFCFFRGPVYVGPHSKISEHASIKDDVAIGHTCKIGGEVEGVVIEAYSNKQHHGFLGHAYLGSWINLGAGTCNSDLKNTYGTVNMTYGDQKVSTGSQFIGCVMGDYSKTAINTSIFTGKTIGVGSMVYGFATTNVPPFVNYGRVFGQLGGVPAEVIISTQKRMFGRRNREQTDHDIQLIHDMYQMTANDRPSDLSNDPIDL